MRILLNNFIWHKTSKTLTAEVSELKMDQLPQFITIHNDKTNEERRFCYMRTDKDQEGDIQAWYYYNSQSDIKLVIYND